MSINVEDKNNIPKLTAEMQDIMFRVSKKVGEYLEGKILDMMHEQYPEWPSLSASTMAQKGSKKAWIDTGELWEQITYRVTTGNIDSKIEIGIFDHDKGLIARWLEFGTDPYVILPKNKKVLSWKDKGGKRHIAKQVNHPGIPERPLFRLVFDLEKENVEQLINRELDKELSKFMTF
ncbi:MAG: hypothetical protein JXQ82_07730 [Methanomicrobiaceae archaeon]|nr:hypothetical protein [Methanomicrobiaceae archaeon]